jgi:hypothetical protein
MPTKPLWLPCRTCGSHRQRFQLGRQRLVPQPVAKAVVAAGEFGQRAAPCGGAGARGTLAAPAAGAAEYARAWAGENPDSGSRRPASVSARPVREFRRGGVHGPPRR